VAHGETSSATRGPVAVLGRALGKVEAFCGPEISAGLPEPATREYRFMLRPRSMAVLAAFPFGLWYCVPRLWALVLRRMAQSVSSWDESRTLRLLERHHVALEQSTGDSANARVHGEGDERRGLSREPLSTRQSRASERHAGAVRSGQSSKARRTPETPKPAR
jgi:hypothetical protein